MKKVRMSNKFLYALVILGIFTIICVGVYALTPGVKPKPGHLLSEIAPPAPCSTNQILIWNGSSIICNNGIQQGQIVAQCPSSSQNYSVCNFTVSRNPADYIFCDGRIHLFYYSGTYPRCLKYEGGTCSTTTCTFMGYLAS